MVTLYIYLKFLFCHRGTIYSSKRQIQSCSNVFIRKISINFCVHMSILPLNCLCSDTDIMWCCVVLGSGMCVYIHLCLSEIYSGFLLNFEWVVLGSNTCFCLFIGYLLLMCPCSTTGVTFWRCNCNQVCEVRVESSFMELLL